MGINLRFNYRSAIQHKLKLLIIVLFYLHRSMAERTSTSTAGGVVAHMQEAPLMQTDGDDSKPDLGACYSQCSSAREASIKTVSTDIDSEGQFIGTGPSNYSSIGSLDRKGDEYVTKTFHGARFTKGQQTVNECISLTFDPATLVCVTCKTEHNIIPTDGRPLAIVVSDQNFVTKIGSAEDNSCIPVVRLENATLSELVDLSLEIFHNVSIKAGSIFIIGSGSFLFRGGASAYANEWLKCLKRFSARWDQVHICPLIPILSEDCPGSLSRDLIELATWLAKSYSDNTSGLLDCWSALIHTVRCNSAGSTPLTCADVVKLAMPVSITSTEQYAHHFQFNSSCPAALLAQDRKTSEELVLVLIQTINRDFSVRFDPGTMLARSTTMAEGSKGRHLVVVGASNMKRTVPMLAAAGYTVTDLTESGWVASPDNISKLISSLSMLSIPKDFKVVFDLLGNASFRFKQFDGSQSLPYRTNKGFHLAGEVEVANDQTFAALISSLLPIFNSCPNNLKVIIPPLPRYLFKGCCNDSSHCTNLTDPGHPGKLLSKVGHLRAMLKKAIVQNNVKKVWVLDGIGALLGDKPGDIDNAQTQETIDTLDKITMIDGVHYSKPGYANLSRSIDSVIKDIEGGTLTKQMSNCNIAGKNPQFFWRGFVSPVGAGRHSGHQKSRSVRGSRHHPYAGRGGRGGHKH